MGVGPRAGTSSAAPSLTRMRAVQITRFGGPEVLDIVDLPDSVPGEGQQLYDVSTAGVNFADTHHREPARHRAGQASGRPGRCPAVGCGYPAHR
jgi:NADPH:quinone reductase-like Zn-dependent oxidoreductase